MKEIEQLHREAMTLSQQAFLFHRQGNAEQFKNLSREALTRESEAARIAPQDLEPTRSILFRSAATIAIDAEDFCEAEKLIAEGIAGNPPEEILNELRDLNETIQQYNKIKRE